MDAEQKDDSCPGKEDVARIHHTAQKGVQFKTYELLISGIGH